MNFPWSIRTKAILVLVGVAAGYTLLNVAVRLLSEGFQPLTQVYMRHALAFLISVIVFRNHLRWSRIKAIPRKDWLPLLVMGMVGYALYVYLLTLGVLNTKIVNVAILLGLLPFFSYLYSFFLLKKPLQPLLIGLLLVSLLGVGMVGSKSLLPKVAGFGVGELFVVAATAAGAWYSVGRKLVSDHLNNAEVSVLVMGISAVTSLVFALVRGESFNPAVFMNQHIWWGLLLGAGFNILATFGENFSFKHLDVVFGNQILLSENFFALVFGYMLYHEIIGFPELMGGLLILASVLVANRFVKTE